MSDPSKVLDQLFQFGVGDIVYFKTAPHNRDKYPNRFMVVERFVQQCHGGVQFLYKLDPPARDGLVPEIVLCIEKPPYEISMERLKDIANEDVLRRAEEHLQFEAWKEERLAKKAAKEAAESNEEDPGEEESGG